MHLDVVDKSGRTFPFRGDVLRVAPIGQAGGTLVNEGLARWTYEGGADGGPARAMESPSTCTSSTTAEGRSSPSSSRAPRRAHARRTRPMSPRLSTEELAAALGARLGGTVHGLRRLSGGASRVTSSFDLETAEGATRPLILQMDRSGGAPGRAKARLEHALLHSAGDAGVPVPAVVAAPDFERRGC